MKLSQVRLIGRRMTPAVLLLAHRLLCHRLLKSLVCLSLISDIWDLGSVTIHPRTTHTEQSHHVVKTPE